MNSNQIYDFASHADYNNIIGVQIRYDRTCRSPETLHSLMMDASY